MPREWSRWSAILASFALVATVACSPPLAASPTAAPAKPTEKPAAKAPEAPAAKQPEAPAAKPATDPAAKPAEKAPAAGDAALPAMEPALAKAAASFYEDAKKEGKLIIYGAGNPEQFDPTKAAFMKRFPGIEVEGVDQRGRESREKVFAEQRGRNYVVDIVQSGFTTQQELIEAGFVERYGSSQNDMIRADLATAAGELNSRSVTIFSILINTNLVPPAEEPKQWSDLLDPKWRNKLAMDDPRGSGPGGTIISPLEILYGFDFSKKLGEQKIFFATQAGPLVTGVVRGEYAMFISAGHPDAINARASGAPVKFLKLKDGVGITQNSMALIKNAPHGNAAKLWIEWNQSEEGQSLMADVGMGPVRKGIVPKEPEANLEGVTIFPRDDTPEALQTLGDRVKRWEEFFFK